MKYMQAMGATNPQAVTAEVQQSNDRKVQLDAEEKDLLKRYRAAQGGGLYAGASQVHGAAQEARHQ
jgi:hypothetical protein